MGKDYYRITQETVTLKVTLSLGCKPAFRFDALQNRIGGESDKLSKSILIPTYLQSIKSLMTFGGKFLNLRRVAGMASTAI